MSLRAVDTLLDGLVDYAGLFPPANESMRLALENYASYLDGPDRSALGRLIVPLSRLDEFEEAAAEFLPRQVGSDPWKLSVIVTGDTEPAAAEMTSFNGRHSRGSSDGFALIDVVELKASNPTEIETRRSGLPDAFTSYFEIPLEGDVSPLLKTLGRVGTRAKIRTGGVTVDSFPPADSIMNFLMAARRAGVPFKATAGLHHPVRGAYRLTYESGSPSGTMYGYLNLFLAAGLVAIGGTRADALALLEETDSSAFAFSDEAVVWRGHRFDVEQIRSLRNHFAISFGSCSFREPVGELESLVHPIGVGAQ
jgi:hypothetical protein